MTYDLTYDNGVKLNEKQVQQAMKLEPSRMSAPRNGSHHIKNGYVSMPYKLSHRGLEVPEIGQSVQLDIQTNFFKWVYSQIS